MKRFYKIIIIIFVIICFKCSLLFSAGQGNAGDQNAKVADSDTPIKADSQQQYTDVNKKILNIGGAYYHSVKKGDTIWGILMRENQTDPNYYNYYMKELLRLNPQIKDANRIEVGDKLLIPDIVHKRKWKPPKKAKKRKKAPKKLTVKKETAPKEKDARKEPETVVSKKITEPPKETEKPKEDKKKISKPKVKQPKQKPKKKEDEAKITKKTKKEPKKVEEKIKVKSNTGSAPKVAISTEYVSNQSGSGIGGGSAIMGTDLKDALSAAGGNVSTKGVTFFPVTGGKSLRLNNANTPLVYSGNKKVVLDYGNKISDKVEDYIRQKFKYYDFVNVDAGDSDKVIIGKVLKASGYYSIRENKDIKIGANVKLVVSYDWLVERGPDSFLGGDVRLLKLRGRDDAKVPDYIRDYLEKYGFFIKELRVLKKGEKLKSRKRSGRIISIGKSKSVRKVIRSLLQVYGIKFKEGVSLKFHDTDETMMPANFYFEIDSKVNIVNLEPVTPKALELSQSYKINLIQLNTKTDRKEVTKKVLKMLQKDCEYGTFRLIEVEGGKPFIDVELKGFLLGGTQVNGERSKGVPYYTLPVDKENVFITYYKFPSTIKRYLTLHGYVIEQK